MILWLIRFLRGFVSFKIYGSFPERFVNLSVKRGVGIFGLEPHPSYIKASMLLSEYKLIRPIARSSRVRLRVLERHGLPFFIDRNKNRWGLLIGVLFFIVACVSVHNFIWIIEINGVETVSKSAVLCSLEERGVKTGGYKKRLDLHRIERELQLEYEEIGWMSINVTGSKAEVEIKEKTKVPNLEYSPQFYNIKASTDGVILSANVRRGTAEVVAGSGVSKGQLLVSGFYENALGEIHFVDADADILAKTKYTFSSDCSFYQTCLKPLPKTTRSKLEIMWFSFPVTFSPKDCRSSSYTETKQVRILENYFPITFKTQHLCSYETYTCQLSDEEVKRVLYTDLALYKLFALKNAEKIEETVSFIENESSITINANLICRENIAVKEKFVVNE